MRVLLAGPDYEENLSIRYLSSALQDAGHETVLATFNSEADLEAVAEGAEDSDIVGLSMCFQSRALEFLHLAREIKSRDPQKLIVAGGHYASCAAAELLEHHPEIDVIVIHEGERTLVEIADVGVDLEDALPQISGIAYRRRDEIRFTAARHTLDDLDSLPFPDRCGPVHYIAGVPTSYMMGSRGCYGSCAYCCITTLHRIAPGKRFRQRRPELIADEMAALYHHRGIRQFVFHDDNFLVPSESLNHARITAFENALKERGVQDIALVIKCRPADTKLDVFRRLKQLGLVRVFLGIESATPRGLLSLERKQTVDDSVRALEVCAELDVSAQFTIMTFNPDATEETLRSDIMFMRQFRGNPLNFCRAEIYAGTPLEKRMIEVGRARGNYLARVYSMADPVTERAWNIALDLFGTRCWSSNSLMQIAIGLDHTAAVSKRFYSGPERIAVCDDVASWLRTVNLDAVNLLEQVVDISASAASVDDLGLRRAVRDLKEHEAATRPLFLSEAMELRSRLQALRQTSSSQFQQLPGPRLLLAKQLAAAVLAVGTPVASGSFQALAQETKTQSSAGATQNKTTCTLSGTVVDPSGAVIPNATVTVSKRGGKLNRAGKSNQSGHYVFAGLPPGIYSVRVEAPGFSTAEQRDVLVQTGVQRRADFSMRVGPTSTTIEVETPANGCCEYSAIPLEVRDEGTVFGMVTNSSGDVLPDVTVTITDLATKATHMLRTNQVGEYVLRNIVAGRYSVRAELRGFTTIEQPDVVLESGSEARADFTMKPANTVLKTLQSLSKNEILCEPVPAVAASDTKLCSLSGTVKTSTGAPVIAVVTITDRNSKFHCVLQAEPWGRYTADSLPEGEYEVSVESPGYNTSVLPSLVLEHGARQRADFFLNPSSDCCDRAAPTENSQLVNASTLSLFGFVTDETGAAVENATVSIIKLATKEVHKVTTNYMGMYAATDVPAGKYKLKVEPPSFKKYGTEEIQSHLKKCERTGIVLEPGTQQQIDVQLTFPYGGNCGEHAAPPLKPPDHIEGCALSGNVTDPVGAVVVGATISIVNLRTKTTRTLKTGEKGEYITSVLPEGKYTLRIESPGFKGYERKDIVLTPGAQERLDATLQPKDPVGLVDPCCAGPVQPIKPHREPPLSHKKKPLNYVVGTDKKDNHSVYGVAEVVYGDRRHWLTIFEANRDLINKHGVIPDGTKLAIPPEKHEVPKLASKVIPLYPAEAAKENVEGDVVLEVAINNDGTMVKVDVIDGDPLLVDAATTAVKKWRFHSPTGNQRALFVVAISFSKDGKVRIQL